VQEYTAPSSVTDKIYTFVVTYWLVPILTEALLYAMPEWDTLE